MKAMRRLGRADPQPDEARAGFVRHLAHELKTHLANVRHSAELLADGVLGRLSPQQQEVAQILRSNSLKLQWLTEYLLAWQSWTGVPVRSRLGLRALLERSVQRSQVLARPRRVRIALDAPAAEVSLDGAAVGLLLDNLLSHALKCAPPDSAVTLAAMADAKAVVIEIKDEGAPAAPGERTGLPDAFDEEPLGPRDGQPSRRGGLAVARACADAHGGSVEIVADKRGGFVRVRLPAGESAGGR